MQNQRPSLVRPTRRLFLTAAGAAGVLAAGCRPLFRQRAEPAPPDPDVTATAAALDRQQDLLAAYAAAERAHSEHAKDLRAFSKRHEAHAAALRARLPAGHPKKPGRTASPSASATFAGLSDLAHAERAASKAFAAAALDASPTLAQVLASMSACCAAHVPLLRRVTR